MGRRGSRSGPFKRALVAGALSVGLVGATALPALGDNIVVAINTKDGSSIFKFSFDITRVMGDVVDQTNAAGAASSCTDCQTVAIAIQVVLVMSDASTITPTNLAIAINYECDACETLASAVQFVLSTGGPVHFTSEGNKMLAEIRKQLLDLKKSDLSIEEIQARVRELARQLAHVIATELVPAGPPDQGGESPNPAETSPGGETSPSPTSGPTESPSPTESPTETSPPPTSPAPTEPSPTAS
jgi:putative peptide zinc metalloprotease protein